MTLQPVLPWWLLLPLIAAAVAVLVWQLRGPGTSRHQRGRAGRRAAVRHALLALLLVGALLRPGLPGGTAQAAAADLNVFFVVDTTTSMVAEDYGTTEPRMAGVRQDIAAIAEGLPGARFSVITFDTAAHVRMPLTTDTLALDTITSVLEPQVTSYAKGSSITAAREVLSERLTLARQSHPGRPRLVFYLGDGEQTSAEAPAPMDLEDGLVAGGAVLGYGTAGGGRMRENTGEEYDDGSTEAGDASYLRDSNGDGAGYALSRIDESRLQQIAGQLGVPYVHRSAGNPAAPMLQDAHPDAPDTGALTNAGQDGSLAARTELYWIPAAGAFVLGLWELVLLLRQFRELRRIPLAPSSRSAALGAAPATTGNSGVQESSGNKAVLR
ncbi:Ca-activated chloride channel family protein [Pseudarthrobacter oxydans]|uniref:Ca-activated chloride channel family protein n=1 Tax=Pseudarthrobacter oxydans TaxID=1671 RepID=A0AAW8NBQ7_PSEOX|nr:VWA domain-containing protein [Pseudarthrobacter oxydans]MDR6793137.1 Ca-activated chloride channel family protein [Pseudarthrobacter oxydans]MDR7164334.1 Ca-activated chloride channel family protein [Pseudarthrobacter oxydans]